MKVKIEKGNEKRPNETKLSENVFVAEKKAMLEKIIKANEQATGMFNLVLNNFELSQRAAVSDHLLSIIASEVQELEMEMHEAFYDAKKFYEMVFALRIRVILGLDEDKFANEYFF